MTRLKAEDLHSSLANMVGYNEKMLQILGRGYLELASYALGIDAKIIREKTGFLRVGIVPVSSGDGIILGFSQLLSEISSFLGFESKILMPDDKGFLQAKEELYDIILWADDDTYLAENVQHSFAAENGWATGLGFAAALDCMRKINGSPQRAMVLGAGPVGASAAQYLDQRGYQVVLCDKEYEKSVYCARTLKNCLPVDWKELENFAPYHCVVDAAPSDTRYIEKYLAKNPCIAAPCVPCHWTENPQRFPMCYHDPLQLGTSVMLLSAAMLTR